MNNSIKILVFVLLFCSPLFTQPKQLKNFIQVYDALKSGEKVTAIIHYKKCKLVSEGQEYDSPDAVGGMDVLPWEHFAAGLFGKNIAFISSSETVLIYLPKLGYVYNYVKLKISEDNTVEITARYLTTDKYEVKMDETFLSEINDGVNDKAVYFYSH
jgi:hypothetical protein